MAQKPGRIERILASQVIDLERSIGHLANADPSNGVAGRLMTLPALMDDSPAELVFPDQLAVMRYATRILREGQRPPHAPLEVRSSMERLEPDDVYRQFCERALAQVKVSQWLGNTLNQ